MQDIAEPDELQSAVPAANKEAAIIRFLSTTRDEGVCAPDFLALCDTYDVQVGKAMRAYIVAAALSISVRFLVTRSIRTRLNPHTVILDLQNRILGIVPENQLKLKIAMVPKALYNRNLRELLGKTRWSALRKKILDEREHVCEICGAQPDNTSALHAHEEWEYDLGKRPNRVKLVRIGLICNLCHAVEHIGNSMIRVKEGELPEAYLDQLQSHFCVVNGVTINMWESHFNAAWAEWESRSRRTAWRIEFGAYDNLLTDSEREAIQPLRPTSKPRSR